MVLRFSKAGLKYSSSVKLRRLNQAISLKAPLLKLAPTFSKRSDNCCAVKPPAPSASKPLLNTARPALPLSLALPPSNTIRTSAMGKSIAGTKYTCAPLVVCQCCIFGTAWLKGIATKKTNRHCKNLVGIFMASCLYRAIDFLWFQYGNGQCFRLQIFFSHRLYLLSAYLFYFLHIFFFFLPAQAHGFQCA